MYPFEKRLIEVLRRAKLRVTPQRLAIYEALFKGKSHPTVNEVYEHVRSRNPAISLATVYQTLQVLVDLGLAQELSFKEGATRYDANMEPHVNVVCKICGNIDEIFPKEIDPLLDSIHDEIDQTIEGYRFDVYIICDTCQKKERNES
ncbi:MAG: transcriptional repressor [Candidatus Lokiarchaeota archaeon]|nr:transcriptional repressor [Candidatus Lokiarchaeota archaeon]